MPRARGLSGGRGHTANVTRSAVFQHPISRGMPRPFLPLLQATNQKNPVVLGSRELRKQTFGRTQGGQVVVAPSTRGCRAAHRSPRSKGRRSGMREFPIPVLVHPPQRPRLTRACCAQVAAGEPGSQGLSFAGSVPASSSVRARHTAHGVIDRARHTAHGVASPRHNRPEPSTSAAMAKQDARAIPQSDAGGQHGSRRVCGSSSAAAGKRSSRLSFIENQLRGREQAARSVTGRD
jgi:hypothetical protein